jgi:hypothetical protein
MLRACKFCVDSLPGGRWLSCGGNGQHKQHLQKIARSPRANSSFREIECKAHSRALEKPQSPAPACGPVSTADLEKLITFVHDHNNVLVITGAGCSTESNIPDYRGPRGAYTSGFKPMTHQQVCVTPCLMARPSRSTFPFALFSAHPKSVVRNSLTYAEHGRCTYRLLLCGLVLASRSAL